MTALAANARQCTSCRECKNSTIQDGANTWPDSQGGTSLRTTKRFDLRLETPFYAVSSDSHLGLWTTRSGYRAGDPAQQSTFFAWTAQSPCVHSHDPEGEPQKLGRWRMSQVETMRFTFASFWCFCVGASVATLATRSVPTNGGFDAKIRVRLNCSSVHAVQQRVQHILALKLLGHSDAGRTGQSHLKQAPGTACPQ